MGSFLPSKAVLTSRTINSGWEFRSLSATEKPEVKDWHPAQVPGVVQTDLLSNKLIPDPFFGDNEVRLQWIGLADWEYRTTFQVDVATLAHQHVDLVFEGLSPADAARGMDVVLLGLPHKVSAQHAPVLLRSGARIVDLSGDFRLRDPAAYAKYYGATHPCPEELTRGTFVYGLPELHRDAIRKARYVASPGCFATTIELALLPLARAGLLRGPVEIVV